ncbi:hypothetical protein Dimus_024874, partial [Dionaea muscipula]
SSEMKPFQRLLHFIVMKNVVPRFGKRDTTSFMDLTYMDHLLTRRLVNLPRVMLRHMTYVISVPQHELLYGDLLSKVFEAYNVPLNDKEGEEPKKYDFFEETFLEMCQLKREQEVWWLGVGENRRRDDENEEAPAENVEVENMEEAAFNWEVVNEEVELQGEHTEKESEDGDSGFGEKFYDVVDDERLNDEDVVAPADPAPPISALVAQQAMRMTDQESTPRVPLATYSI